MNTNKLLSSGLRQTFQRRKILEFLENTKSHPTADAIYKEVKKSIPTVSKTTIYNTVNKLVKEGIIKSISASGQTRYDACIGCHGHFVCSKCGRVFDVPFPSPSAPKDIDGHEIKDSFAYHTGTCKYCRKKV